MTTINKIEINSTQPFPMYQTQVAAFVKGTDAYENTRLGKELTISNANGESVTGILANKRVGALVELMSEFGPYNAHTFGLPYAPVSFIQALGDAQGEDPLDVTRLYTVLSIQVAPTQPTAPTQTPTA